MSDPVKNVDIEDVLSSIRRLVSDGDRARTGGADASDPSPSANAKPAQDRPEPEGGTVTGDAPRTDRLILTPAFLVADNQSSSGPHLRNSDDTKATSADENQARNAASNLASHQAPEALIGPEPAVEDEFSEPLTLTDMVWDGAETASAAPAPQDPDAPDDATDATGPDTDTDTDTDTATDTASEIDMAAATNTTSIRPDRSGLVATIAELEAAFSRDANDYEPEGNEPMSEVDPRSLPSDLDEADEAGPVIWPGAMARRSRREDAAIEDAEIAGAFEQTHSEDVSPPVQEVETARGAEDAVRSDAADIEPVEANLASQPEPQVDTNAAAVPHSVPERETDTETDTADTPVLTFSQSIRTARDADVTAKVAPADPDDTGAVDAADDYDDDLDDLLDAGGVSLDEAALRDLVTQVVREELTGPLGERITRNVRKLVRREIFRVLSSQDFD